MILYGVIAAAAILACEVGLRLPFARILASFNASAWRAVEVVGSATISDHWKERVLPAYAWRLLKASVALLACIAAIALPVIAVTGPAAGSLAAAGGMLMQPVPLVLMTGVGAGYVWLRLRLRRGRAPEAVGAAGSAEYSALDRTLHKVILGNPMLDEALPALDARIARGAAPVRTPVYVTGLARAGTTVLMRALHGSGQFASLTYADMPFVLAPNLWALLSRAGRKDRTARERAHGDGLVVDFDAPEALEEVFWRTRCGGDYITRTGLVPHDPDAATIAAYRAFQARVCHRHGAARYLAKNNNLMLRLGPLARAMPDARFLVPVRDPIAQAQSLRAQHRRFGAADAFTRDYMRWLVHHEFGPDQRPYRLPGQPVPLGDPDRLEYWLVQWVACYGWLAGIIAAAPGNIRPVIYERLDGAVWAEICAFTGLPADTPAAFRPAPAPAAPEGLDPDLLAQARALYADLAAQAV
ncbi:MAG: hypothetical protein GVY28_09590 [Alphaproteobacteria bacterium]|jgi:hypothetical protein|nr:hypothetical protein [Alphaproteobacteria bacterium]